MEKERMGFLGVAHVAAVSALWSANYQAPSQTLLHQKLLASETEVCVLTSPRGFRLVLKFENLAINHAVGTPPRSSIQPGHFTPQPLQELASNSLQSSLVSNDICGWTLRDSVSVRNLNFFRFSSPAPRYLTQMSSGRVKYLL